MTDGQLPGSLEKLREVVHLDPVPPKSVGVRLLPDDVWVMDIGSAGGYGDPIKRDPEAVREDVRDGLPEDQARRIYGVIFSADGVDLAETAHRRKEIIGRSGWPGRMQPLRKIATPGAQRRREVAVPIGEELKVIEIDGTLVYRLRRLRSLPVRRRRQLQIGLRQDRRQPDRSRRLSLRQ